MQTQVILNSTNHRPWKIPTGKWKFYQEWCKAIFLHWEVDEKVLREFVPENIEIDLFKGKAWVSLVAFTMEKIRPRNLPSFPPISNFEEINLRTYVKSNNKSGVYFINIEGSKKVSCFLSKIISGLPYYYSKMDRDDSSFNSENIDLSDLFKIKFEVQNTIPEKNDLDIWLTERYSLFHNHGEKIFIYEIHHLPWQLKEIEIHNLELNYPRFRELLENRAFISHYSEGVKVIAWNKSIENL